MRCITDGVFPESLANISGHRVVPAGDGSRADSCVPRLFGEPGTEQMQYSPVADWHKIHSTPIICLHSPRCGYLYVERRAESLPRQSVHHLWAALDWRSPVQSCSLHH